MQRDAQSDSHWAPDAKKFLEDVEAQLPDVFKTLNSSPSSASSGAAT